MACCALRFGRYHLSTTFTGLASNSLGLQFVSQPCPVTPALYVVSIRQTRDWPPASFRFHLAMAPFALNYVLGTIYLHSGLAPVRRCPCRAHDKNRPHGYFPWGQFFTFYTLPAFHDSEIIHIIFSIHYRTSTLKSILHTLDQTFNQPFINFRRSFHFKIYNSL